MTVFYHKLQDSTFDSLLEEYFFEDAFEKKIGIYPSYFDVIWDSIILQIPQEAESRKYKRMISYKVSNVLFVYTKDRDCVIINKTGEDIPDLDGIDFYNNGIDYKDVREQGTGIFVGELEVTTYINSGYFEPPEHDVKMKFINFRKVADFDQLLKGECNVVDATSIQ